MTLIVILNAVLAILIVAVIVALHSRAIVTDARAAAGAASPGPGLERAGRPAAHSPDYWPVHHRRARAARRRQEAIAAAR